MNKTRVVKQASENSSIASWQALAELAGECADGDWIFRGETSNSNLTSGLRAEQQLTTIAMPLKEGSVDFWEFYGDKLIGVDLDRRALKLGLSPNDIPVSRKRS